MQLINCKVELKLKWTKYCLLAVATADNADAKSNNIIFTIQDTKLYVLVTTLSAKDNQKRSKVLSKGFERSVYWNEYKTKRERIKTWQVNKRYLLESNFVGIKRLFVLLYSNQDDNAKRFKARRNYLPKGII